MRTTAREALIEIDTPVPAPSWALLERQLLDAQAQACAEFFARYFDDRGYLLCVPRWSGDDGPDDAIENLLNWTMLHALGADDRDPASSTRRGWRATSASTPRRRRPRCRWAATACTTRSSTPASTGSTTAKPGRRSSSRASPTRDDRALVRRMRRWAGMYMAEDPHIPNYDPEHRVIR